MSEALEIKFARMEEQNKHLTQEVAEVKADIKRFPKLLEEHSNSIKLYLDNSVDSHLRDKGGKMFSSRYIQTWAVPLLFACVGGLAFWVLELALRK